MGTGGKKKNGFDDIFLSPTTFAAVPADRLVLLFLILYFYQ
jgi:hypothetical protein